MTIIYDLFSDEKNELLIKENSIKNEINTNAQVISGILAFIGSLFSLIFTIDFGLMLQTLIFLCGVFALYGLFYYILKRILKLTNPKIKNLKKDQKALAKRICEDEKINNSPCDFSDHFAKKFYAACKANKIVVDGDEISALKAKQLIRQNPAFQINNIEQKYVAAYERGLDFETAAKNEKRAAANKRRQDEKIKENTKKFSKILMEHILFYFEQGYEKKLHMMQIEYEQKCEKDNAAIAAYDEYFHKYLSVDKVKWEKKADWAVMGGIADAIAGPAAGIAAAYQTIENNAAVDKRNMATLAQHNMMAFGAPQSPSDEEIIERDKNYEKQVEKAKKRLEDDSISKEELFNNLECKFTKPKKDISGFITTKISIKEKEPQKIAGKIKANIDGALSMNFYNKGKLVHSAPISLPVDGVNTSCDLTMVVGTFNMEQNSVSALDINYDKVDLVPEHLCLFEKI